MLLFEGTERRVNRIMTPSELEKIIFERLSKAGTDNARQEAGWLAERAAGIPLPEFPLSCNAVSPERVRAGLASAERRASGEPLQYILGDEVFGDLNFLVGPGVLIPRPETYGLAELALALLPARGTFCELGTGSGAVALSVAAKRPDVKVFASEISPDAMKWAEKNRAALRLDNADLRLGSLFEPFRGMKFDFAAANLPYIPYSEKKNLQREVRDFEPGTALFADDSGMALVKEALGQAPEFLKPGGTAAFEAGTEQLPELCESAKKYFAEAHVMRDCFGAERFLVCRTA